MLGCWQDSTWKNGVCTQVRRSNYLVPEEVLVGDILERPREDEVDELLVVLPLPLLPRSTFPVHLRHPADPCGVMRRFTVIGHL